jgi:chitin deacetylase
MSRDGAQRESTAADPLARTPHRVASRPLASRRGGDYARANRMREPAPEPHGRVALTFDDGPGPSTAALLDVLATRGVRATFFLLGRNVERWPSIAARVAREGHALGNHTHSHARPDAITPEALRAEIVRTDALLCALARDAGVPLAQPIPLRLPYGLAPNDPRGPVLAALGREHCGWTADFRDWESPPPELLAQQMQEHIDQRHARGLEAVLDLHDSSREGAARPATVEAVRRLLGALAASAFFTCPAVPGR